MTGTDFSLQAKKTSILVIGDLMVDAYLWGKVERISPEAPVPIVDILKEENRLGGAANVALNLFSMGAVPLLCGITGQDAAGQTFLNLLEEKGLTCDGILQSETRRTTIKTRIIGQQQQVLRIDKEDRHLLSKEEQELIFEKASALLEKAQGIIFEDYDKGLLNRELIQKIISLAKDKNIPVFVDPKFRNFLSFSGCTVFKPNLKELREGLSLGIDKDHPEVLPEVVRLLKTKMPHDNTLITLSEKGVWFQDVNGEITHWPAHERKITDVSGAGDTVISVFALAWILGMKGKNAAALANLAGGLVCEEVGVIPVDTEKLIQEARILGILQ
jgi:rfaE bifunctional protein kinase chain/domain